MGDLRRVIRSPVTAAILVLLYTGGPMDAEELLEEVERLTGRELSLQSLYRYLYYYERKGWLARGSPVWSLTEYGETRVEKYARRLARILGLELWEILGRDTSNTTTTTGAQARGEAERREERHKEHPFSYPEVNRIEHSSPCISTIGNELLSRVEVSRNLVEFSRKRVEQSLQRGKLCSTREKYSRIAGELGEEERLVLGYLVEHKCKWGSNYSYFDELLEELNMPAEELLRVLRRLQSRRLVYLYEDKRKRAVRVGLGRALRE